ncbi:phosphopantothenate/pantothenate synthetase [Candidatus Woesearchaeota archaeon]|nr:phosphopantothenate/pantothenate synthetase [Candidatus Woesearchaeota archaeon]
MNDVPKSHPRYLSLKTRDKIVKGIDKGVTSIHGLLAHGRGEAFDYLIGEKTNDFAKKAIDAASAMLLTAKHPVISVNGNAAALAGKGIVRLSKVIPAAIEVNIFHTSRKRERAIKKELIRQGAKKVLIPSKKHHIKHIEHNRKFVNKDGIYSADVVFVPLEDGDRCEALINNGKKVIAVDLNPMSRTAKTASITIVDNIARVMKAINERAVLLKRKDKTYLKKIIISYGNKTILKQARDKIRKNLQKH